MRETCEVCRDSVSTMTVRVNGSKNVLSKRIWKSQFVLDLYVPSNSEGGTLDLDKLRPRGVETALAVPFFFFLFFVAALFSAAWRSMLKEALIAIAEWTKLPHLSALRCPRMKF